MKEQLQQIQAVAVVTFLCILISVNSTGDYGKWFVIDGARETVDPVTGNATQYNTFQYHYYLESYLVTDTTGNSQSVVYESQECTYCLNKLDSSNNAKMTAYAAGVLALVVAYMANNAVSSLHQNTLRYQTYTHHGTIHTTHLVNDKLNHSPLIWKYLDY